jgi:hypothetical protein
VKDPSGDAGFASTQFLFLLLFLSSLAAGTGMVVSAALGVESRERETNRALAEINAILEGITADLYADPSPRVNGSDDPVMLWNGRTQGDYTVRIESLSDRLNPNFIRKNIFEKTGLSVLLNPGKTADGLQQFREDRGLSLAPGAYGDFFSGEIGKTYFSGYGWANINLIDEFAARRLVLALTGSEQKAGAFHEKIRSLLLNQQVLGASDLRQVLSGDYDELFPFINAEPWLNVNYLAPLLLRELIAYPDYGVQSPEAKYRELLDRRSAGSLDGGQIQNILQIDPANPLLHYLGSITWFWEIVIEGRGRSCRTVLCRLPPENPEQQEQPRFSVIERRYY